MTTRIYRSPGARYLTGRESVGTASARTIENWRLWQHDMPTIEAQHLRPGMRIADGWSGVRTVEYVEKFLGAPVPWVTVTFYSMGAYEPYGRPGRVSVNPDLAYPWFRRFTVQCRDGRYETADKGPYARFQIVEENTGVTLGHAHSTLRTTPARDEDHAWETAMRYEAAYRNAPGPTD
jgi:hypothetical protein